MQDTVKNLFVNFLKMFFRDDLKYFWTRSIGLGLILLICSVQLGAESATLREFLQKTGASMRWDPLRHLGELSKNGKTVIFRSGDPWMILNGRKLFVTGTVLEEQGKLVFSREAADTLFHIYGIQTASSPYRLTTILIDPGHGGRDSGALRHWKSDGVLIPLAEKDIVLDISLRLAEKLRRLYPGKDILLTRDRDKYPSLEERIQTANSIPLDSKEGMIYISIHANASLNPRAEGYEVWYLPKNYRRNLIDNSAFPREAEAIAPIINALWEEEFTHESIRLADMVLEEFQIQLGDNVPNRGRREESWFVVRNAKMASILLEVGFITNSDEAARLRTPEYLRLITEGIYNGIRRFVDYFEEKK